MRAPLGILAGTERSVITEIGNLKKLSGEKEKFSLSYPKPKTLIRQQIGDAKQTVGYMNMKSQNRSELEIQIRHSQANQWCSKLSVQKRL